MATAVEKGLVCPVCIDVFRDATILCCGHTFCRNCLECCDAQHVDREHIACLVCRRTTSLGQDRIAGLTPNLLVQGLEEELQGVVEDKSSNFCVEHSQLHRDIFCEVCEQVICLKCYLHKHREHNFKKKEELEGELKRRIDILNIKSRAKVSLFEELKGNVEQCREGIRDHLHTMEKEIRNIFTNKVTMLLKNEQKLIEKLDEIWLESEEQFDCCIIKHRQLVDEVNSSLALLSGYQDSDLDMLLAHLLKCSDVENALEKPIDKDVTEHIKQEAKRAQFHPAEGELLAIGQIELEVKSSASDIPTLKRKAEEMEETKSDEVAHVPAAATNSLLNIVIKIELPACMSGMAALCNDAVVVGYYEEVGTADCLYVSGKKEQYLGIEGLKVCDIAFLSDGRPVVSHGKEGTVYTAHMFPDLRFLCRGFWKDAKLCTDQQDNIYFVNRTPEICILNASYPDEVHIVPTGDVDPAQVCVTRTGMIITCECTIVPSRLTVFDREGNVGSIIWTGDEEDESLHIYMHATVDSQDRVLVAQIWIATSILSLDRYTLEGKTLVKETTFKPLQLPVECDPLWSYMVSLTPKMIAFANCEHLYFIELSE